MSFSLLTCKHCADAVCCDAEKLPPKQLHTVSEWMKRETDQTSWSMDFSILCTRIEEITIEWGRQLYAQDANLLWKTDIGKVLLRSASKCFLLRLLHLLIRGIPFSLVCSADGTRSE